MTSAARAYLAFSVAFFVGSKVLAQETQSTTAPNQDNLGDPRVMKCSSFLRPQRVVDRDEFMEYMLKEATMDVIQEKSVTCDVSSLKARMLDEDGDFFRNSTTSLPDYSVLPSYLLDTFVEKACSFQVDVDQVARFCRRFPKNLTDIPRRSGIRFGAMSSGNKKDQVANMTCTESYSNWQEVVENVLAYYAQEKLVTGCPTKELPQHNVIESTTTLPPEENLGDRRVTKCTSFLRPQQVVDRDEFMEYMLKEATLDAIQKKDGSCNVSPLKARMLDETGEFFRNSTNVLPEYWVLPAYLRNIFVDQACSYRVDVDRVTRYCRSSPKNLTDIPRRSGISFGDMSNGGKKDQVANTTCTESFELWSEVVENVLAFYEETSLVSGCTTKVLERDNAPVTAPPSEEDLRQTRLEKCTSFLRPQRVVDRDEFMDFMLRESTMDIIQRQSATWDVSALKARMLDEDGTFFRNASNAFPEYTVLPPFLLNTFVDKACSYRVDVDRVARYCRTAPKNLTDIPRLSGISFGSMSNGAKKDQVANSTCTESFFFWPKVVEDVMAYYMQNNLVSAYPTPSPTPSPTLSPTKNPTPAPTKAPTKSPTKSPTESPTEAPTSSPTVSATPELLSVPVPPFLLSMDGIDEQSVDKVELLEKTQAALREELTANAGPDQEFVAVNLTILTEAEEKTGRLLQSESSFVATIFFAGSAFYHGSAPDESVVKASVHEAVRSDKYMKSLRSSNNEAMRNVKSVEVTFEGDEVGPRDDDEVEKKGRATLKITIGVLSLVFVFALLAFIYWRMQGRDKDPKKSDPVFESKKNVTVNKSGKKYVAGDKSLKKMDSDFGEEIPL